MIRRGSLSFSSMALALTARSGFMAECGTALRLRPPPGAQPGTVHQARQARHHVTERRERVVGNILLLTVRLKRVPGKDDVGVPDGTAVGEPVPRIGDDVRPRRLCQHDVPLAAAAPVA